MVSKAPKEPSHHKRRGIGYEYSLSMASPCHKLMFLVHEADGRVRKRLADCG
jgi:hypothetical protein